MRRSAHLTPRWDLHAGGRTPTGASVDSGKRRPDHGPGQRQEWRAPAATHAAAASDFAGSLRQPDRCAWMFHPGSYLPRATADTAFLPAGQRHRRRDGLRGPGPNAVGFELDACLPAPAGGIVFSERSYFALISVFVMITIGPYVLPSPVVLAPMAGVTDRPFRILCRKLGAGLAASEMLTSDTRLWNTAKSRFRMSHEGEPEPRKAWQLRAPIRTRWQKPRGSMSTRVRRSTISNMGCPAKKVCGKLCGSALLQDESLVARILETVVGAVSVFVTPAIRTGWDREHRNGVSIARIAESQEFKHLPCMAARARIFMRAPPSTRPFALSNLQSEFQYLRTEISTRRKRRARYLISRVPTECRPAARVARRAMDLPRCQRVSQRAALHNDPGNFPRRRTLAHGGA